MNKEILKEAKDNLSKAIDDTPRKKINFKLRKKIKFKINSTKSIKLFFRCFFILIFIFAYLKAGGVFFNYIVNNEPGTILDLFSSIFFGIISSFLGLAFILLVLAPFVFIPTKVFFEWVFDNIETPCLLYRIKKEISGYWVVL